MAKRHAFKDDISSRIRRMQELIMARSGVDEFYEIIRIILAKFYAEREGIAEFPSMSEANKLLSDHARQIADILDGVLHLQTPDDLFPELRRILGSISVSGQDFTALDDAFEQLTSRTYKSDKGQFFTPRHVVDMCIEALDPKPGEIVCDPACGSGAFLKSAHSYSTRKYGSASGLIGFDYSHRAVQVAKTISILATDGDISINQIDSLKVARDESACASSDTIEGHMGNAFHGFDIIATNPPFAGSVNSSAFAEDYALASVYQKRLERDILFVERCMMLLKEGGRLAIVLPDNKVSSRNFSDLRYWISRNSELKGVVSLHRYTFLPYTSQKASVLFAVKRSPSMKSYNSQILFCRSDKPGKTSNGAPDYRSSADLTRRPYEVLDHDLDEAATLIRGVL